MGTDLVAADIGDLFEEAADDGLLSPDSVNVLAVPDVGQQIQGAMGVDVDDVMASDVVLVTLMPDDSGSIQFGGNAQAVRDGHNGVLDALRASQQADQIFVHNRYLNGKILYPYTGLDNAVEMDTRNYNDFLGTPLYDQAVVVLGGVLAKAQTFAQNAVPARTVTLLITDGEDAHSTRYDARDVKTIVDDMFASETHIVAGMGVDNGRTDFARVFGEMGIPDQWILTPGDDPKDISRAFQLFSQSAIKVSQTAGNLSQVALGGFGG